MSKLKAERDVAEPTFEQALELARAVGTLVLLLRTAAGEQSAVAQRDQVRAALRTAVAAARATALELRLIRGELSLAGVRIPPDSPLRSETLDALVGGLAAHGSTMLDVRRGAAPGELLALARQLATDVGARPDGGAWRSWSVRITPAFMSAIEYAPSLPDAVQHELGVLQTVRRDDELRAVVESLVRLCTSPPWKDDAGVVEAIALTVVSEARRRGTRSGRLALESAIRRLLTPDVINTLVRRLPASHAREQLMTVLARAGDLAVKALVHLLQDADTLAERRVCFDAIVALDAGDDALREALLDDRWYVVRNAASLLGEMGVVEADVHLVPLLAKDDERLRTAGARSLTRLGTERALVALQGMLTDPVPELRRLAAAAHGARSQGKPSITALLSALDAESDEDVVLEIIAVLGALGSPDAVQRLMRIVKSDSPEVEPWRREAAYNALVAARGGGVLKLLE